MSEFQHRLIAVMNKSLESGTAMNALAHISLALGSQIRSEQLQLIDYFDADSNCYPNISKMPFVILQANSNKIKNLHEQAIANNIQHITFTNTMTAGTWQEQLFCSQQTKTDDLIFYGIVLFGDAAAVTELTNKFSLWR